MKFIPKNKKFNKVFKLRFKNKSLIDNKTIKLNYGSYGIKALSTGLLTVKHYSALQLIIRKSLKKRGKFWFRRLPYTFTTQKPLEVRMGKGKGNHNQWVCPITIGQILIEFEFNNQVKQIEKYFIFRRCLKRLPVKGLIIFKKTKILNGLYSNNFKMY